MSGELLHGEASTYVNHGCRCQPCRTAHAARSREYRSAHKGRGDDLKAKRALKSQRFRDAQAEVVRQYRAAISVAPESEQP